MHCIKSQTFSMKKLWVCGFMRLSQAEGKKLGLAQTLKIKSVNVQIYKNYKESFNCSSNYLHDY